MSEGSERSCSREFEHRQGFCASVRLDLCGARSVSSDLCLIIFFDFLGFFWLIFPILAFFVVWPCGTPSRGSMWHIKIKKKQI